MPASTLIFPCREFHGQFDQPNVFLKIDRGRFAGGTDGNDAVNAAFDLRFDQAFKRGFINFSVRNGVTMAV